MPLDPMHTLLLYSALRSNLILSYHLCLGTPSGLIIIIGETAFLRRFCQICLELDCLVLTTLDFAAVIFFTEQSRQIRVQPPIWRTRSLHLCP